ncbi:hypothetical protein FMM05_06945 [Flavobacterium zepuense]|uniref:Lipoprotein n=1 Tax=Flavobacterium zepuense TaxID=2593302 RepID=A0A552V646_9FLAO|nr:hypothetical protein [Flavobacterium zepuense]TRW25954.1 hypothetical protein FMM05_06945 [Flavobacterium zepuense]
MKKLLFGLLFAYSLTANAQDCDYSVNDATAGQELKTTREYLMHEKVFGGTSQFVFFSLSNSQGVPLLNFQLLSKSTDFTRATCLDSASKIYIQLLNGKIITLISATEEQCSGLIYDEKEKNNIRILTGVFLFTKGTLEELEKSPISFIRVKYATETVDYTIKNELQSETMARKYNPESYFMNALKCIK